MTTKEIEYFLSVYSTHSIKISAEKLFVSSQALSKIIKKIEEELKVTLFTRTNSGLLPTRSADKLAQHAYVIKNEFDNIASAFSIEEPEEKIVLTIAATYGVVEYLGCDFVKQFYLKHPRIKLNLIELPEVYIEDLLSKNEIELAFMPAPIDYSVFAARPCFTWKHCLIINQDHPLAKKTKIEYKDLEGIPLALKGRFYSAFPSNISRFLKEGVHPNILVETTSEALIHDVAEKNEGIGISLDFLAKKRNAKNIVIKEFADKQCVKEVYLVTKRRVSMSSDAESFFDFWCEWLENSK